MKRRTARRKLGFNKARLYWGAWVLYLAKSNPHIHKGRDGTFYLEYGNELWINHDGPEPALMRFVREAGSRYLAG